MGSQSKKGEESEVSEERILSRLDILEKRIEHMHTLINEHLKRTEHASVSSTEDQLFFGFVFSLALFLVAIPKFDICEIVLAPFQVEFPQPKGFLSTREVLIASLILASVIRYLIVFARDDVRRNRFRKISVGFLMFSPYIAIFDLFLRGLTTLLMDINVFLVFIPPMTLTVIVILIGYFIERRWVRLYGYDDLSVSMIFGWMGLVITIVYYLVIVVAVAGIPVTDIVVWILFPLSIAIVYLISKTFTIVHKRVKRAHGT